MSHIVSREPWATIDLNVAESRVFVREDWLYVWVRPGGQPEWTVDERQNFHHLVDRSIWSLWSSRALIRVRPTHPARPSTAGRIRQQLVQRPLTVTFDARRVITGQHWTVLVTKVDPKIAEKPRAEVKFEKKKIFLYSTDLLVHRARRFKGDEPLEGFKVHPHEFGHTLSNEDEYRLVEVDGKEYKPEFYDDRQSIMNVGRRLRARHFTLLCQTLTRMVPGCEFVPFIGSRLGS